MALEVDATTSVNPAKNVHKNVVEAKMLELKWKIPTPRASPIGYSKEGKEKLSFSQKQLDLLGLEILQ